uniref:Uncharacterized protein n=1 Tax=Arundo donax TaxID=35708 RepID=A0A0A9DMD9_ARUDO
MAGLIGGPMRLKRLLTQIGKIMQRSYIVKLWRTTGNMIISKKSMMTGTMRTGKMISKILHLIQAPFLGPKIGLSHWMMTMCTAWN